MANEMVNLSSFNLRRGSSKVYMTSVYIKQFYSVGKRMPDADTIPVLQLPPHTHAFCYCIMYVQIFT